MESEKEILLTIIVNSGNFQPRVLTLPKNDFPKEHYDILVKHSEEHKGRRMLVQQILRKNKTGINVETEWSPITNEIYSIVDDSCDMPDWCKNATFDRDHGFFNSELIDTGDNQVFEVIEEECYEDYQEGQPKRPTFQTVDELKEWYVRADAQDEEKKGEKK